MVALAHEKGLKTEIITNGHLLDKNMARGLYKGRVGYTDRLC